MIGRREFLALIGAVVYPRAVSAQLGDQRRIGFLTIGLTENDPLTQFFQGTLQQALLELGWSEERNIRIDRRFGAGDVARASKLAKELIDLKPDAVVAQGTNAAIAFRQHTLSLPIVFLSVPDPVAAGLVTNLARPNGNITGFSNFDFSIGEKWLQLLKECAPSLSRVAILFDPASANWTAYLRAIEAAAPAVGVQLIPAAAQNAEQIESAISSFAEAQNGALLVMPSISANVYRQHLINVAERYRLPAVYSSRAFTADGGLMSYGVNVIDLIKGAAQYVDRILRGAKPADLPVQQPAKFELIVNLRAAKTLGLTIPQSVLLRTDEVIE
jgi:putative ABC transport system substrate-binding protein